MLAGGFMVVADGLAFFGLIARQVTKGELAGVGGVTLDLGDYGLRDWALHQRF